MCYRMAPCVCVCIAVDVVSHFQCVRFGFYEILFIFSKQQYYRVAVITEIVRLRTTDALIYFNKRFLYYFILFLLCSVIQSISTTYCFHKTHTESWNKLRTKFNWKFLFLIHEDARTAAHQLARDELVKKNIFFFFS